MGSNIPYVYNKISSFDNLKRITRFDLEMINGYNDEDFLYNFVYKLNEIIEQQNIVGEAFQQVLNWANNMLQEYTQEQLQQWLDDGTIQEMIQKLVFTFFTYNTIKEALSDNGLKEGDRILTYGYNGIEDLGSAKYVVSSTPDEFNLKLNNGLYANILAETNMNVHQFGMFGDDETNYTELYQKIINFTNIYGDSSIYIPAGTYLISGIDTNTEPNANTYLRDTGGIKVPSNYSIIHDKLAIMKVIPTNYTAYHLYRVVNVENVSIEGGSLLGDRDNHYGTYGSEFGFGIDIQGSKNIKIKNMSLSKFWGDGIITQYSQSSSEVINCENIIIDNVISDNNRRQGLSLCSGINVQVRNSAFTNTNGTAPESGIDIEPSIEEGKCEHIYIIDCEFYGNAGRNITGTGIFTNNIISDVNILRCYFKDCYNSDNYNIAIADKFTNFTLKDCLFNCVDTGYIILLNANGIQNVIGCTFIDGYIQTFNNQGTYNILSNNISYNKTQFLQLSHANIVNFINNIVNKTKSQFIVLSSSDIAEVNVAGNIFNDESNTRISLINLNNNTTTKINIYNNTMTEQAYVYDGNPTTNCRISQGGIGGLYTANLPNNPCKGDMIFISSTGKVAVYTSAGWRYIATTTS